MQISKQGVQKAFSRSANSYDDAAILQKEILTRLIDRLATLKANNVIKALDVGSGTGLACQRLEKMYGSGSYFAYDFSSAMLELARNQYINVKQYAVCGDAEALPFKDNIFDVVFSASTLQWCNDVTKVFANCYSALNEEGLFIFSSFGPETLIELRECFAKIDRQPHVSSFLDMQTLGDGMLASGFFDPVVESEIITVEYSSPLQLLRDLKATGATNNLQNRSRGLMGKSHISLLLEEYENLRLDNGKYPATYQVVYCHGWKHSDNISNQSGANGWQQIKLHK